MAGDDFEVFSAGTKPTEVHPQTFAVLEKFEVNDKDIYSKDVSEYQHIKFDYVINFIKNKLCHL